MKSDSSRLSRLLAGAVLVWLCMAGTTASAATAVTVVGLFPGKAVVVING